MITLQQAHDRWTHDIRPVTVEHYGEGDGPALAESWNNFTDALCKDGELCDLQYHYCPAYDEDMPDDDFEFVRDELGVLVSYVRIAARTDGLMGDMPDGSRCYKVTVERGNDSFTQQYSKGPALHGFDAEDFLATVLSEAEMADHYDGAHDFAREMGYGEWVDTDSDERRRVRAQWRAIKLLDDELTQMFSGSEREQLLELAELCGHR